MVSVHADLSKPSMILTPICFGLPANLFRWVLTWDGQFNHILQWFPFCNDHITLGGPRKVWPALSGFLPFGKKLIPDLGFQRINTCRKVLDIYQINWTGFIESAGFTGYTGMEVLDGYWTESTGCGYIPDILDILDWMYWKYLIYWINWNGSTGWTLNWKYWTLAWKYRTQAGKYWTGKDLKAWTKSWSRARAFNV